MGGMAASQWGDPRTGPRRSPLAIGGELSPTTIVQAYRGGVFPWSTSAEGPHWWSPDPRCIILTGRWKAPHGLAKAERKPGWKITTDRAFDAVIEACATVPRPGQDGTWITPAFLTTYRELHRQGLAHSVEVWREEQLVGGLYGLQIGNIFCGESMFHRTTDASKIAFSFLIKHLHQHHCPIIDCQVPNPHLQSLGALNCPRSDYLDILEKLCDDTPTAGLWPQG